MQPIENYNNKNGRGIIKIKTTTGGSYFMLDHPLAILWSDCGGSVAQYFALTHYSTYVQNSITNKLDSCIYNTYNNIAEVTTDFKELFNLLESGAYHIEIEKEFKKGDWYDDLVLTYNENENLTKKQVFEHNKATTKISQQAISTSANWFYDQSYGHGTLFFTRAFETINQERVAFFENEIKNGKRPFAILLRKTFYSHIGDSIESSHSGWFVVDGHHKLIAYQNQKQLPPFLKITEITTKENYFNFNTSDIEPCLMQIQIEHITNNISWY